MKKILLTLFMAVGILVSLPGTAHAAEKITAGDCTIYYTKDTISASLNTLSEEQCHYEYTINSVTVSNTAGDTRIVLGNNLTYYGLDTSLNGTDIHIDKIPIPIDTSRHTIASVNDLASDEKITSIDITTTKVACTFNDNRYYCNQKKCVYCSKVYMVDEEHDYEWVVDKEPTCTTVGTKHQECKVCGAIGITGVSIDALGHDYQTATTTQNNGIKEAATYTSNAVYYQKCSRCTTKDAKKYNEVSGTKLTCNHTLYPDAYYVWIIDKAATATEAGLKHQECKICGDKKASVSIPAGTSTSTSTSKKTSSNNSSSSSDTSNTNNSTTTTTTSSTTTGDTGKTSTSTDTTNTNTSTSSSTNDSDENGIIVDLNDLTNDTETEEVKSDNALTITPADITAQVEEEAGSTIPYWGFVLIEILVAVAALIALWEFFLRDRLKKKKNDKRVEY